VEHKKIIEELIGLYETASNLYSDVTPTMWEKHIKGIEESDILLDKQVTLKKRIVKLIDKLYGTKTKLSTKLSPFEVKSAEIKDTLLK